MDDHTENEEQLTLLQQVNEALMERADLQQQVIDQNAEIINQKDEIISLQEETINLQGEQLKLKDQQIMELKLLNELLSQQLQATQGPTKTDLYESWESSSSARFSRPPKSPLKKRHHKRG